MIRAMFEENVRKTEARGLVQWDYGQILQIEGLKGIDHAEVHFAVKECSAKAEICIATIEENRILADIPDKLLEVGKDLIAYVYIADAMSGKTVRIIELPVKKREQPGDYSTPSGKNLLRQVLESLEKKADNMTVIDGELQYSYCQVIHLSETESGWRRQQEKKLKSGMMARRSSGGIQIRMNGKS